MAIKEIVKRLRKTNNPDKLAINPSLLNHLLEANYNINDDIAKFQMARKEIDLLNKKLKEIPVETA